MKFLGVGLGSIGQRHFNNLHKLSAGELLAYRKIGGKLRSIDESLFTNFDSLERALDQHPDAVLITNPTNLHISIALKAAERGCHLFIEKPLSHNLDGVDELLKIVEEKRLVTLMGCNLRFHPCIMAMKQLIDKKAIGNIISARVECASYMPGWHPWEDYRKSYSARKSMGGGAILTNIHELDYLYWFFGDVDKVFSFAGKYSSLEMDAEDTAEILLRFKSGVAAEVHLDFVSRDYRRSCEIIGEEGTIFWDFNENKVRVFTAKQKKWETVKSIENFDFNQTYNDEMKHFINCINGKETSINDVHEGKKVLDIALLAKKSAEEERVLKVQ